MNITACVVFDGVVITQRLYQGTMMNILEPFTKGPFILLILYLGILFSWITSFLATYGLERLEAKTVGLFNNMVKVISILGRVLFSKEKL